MTDELPVREAEVPQPGGGHTAVPPLEPAELGEDWPHLSLFKSVRNALFALPAFFESDLTISGVLATDLFTFNASLGATIEAQVVDALNALRESWDPHQEYTLYRFVRQPQRFPDVILRASAPEVDPPIILGVEWQKFLAIFSEDWTEDDVARTIGRMATNNAKGMTKDV